MDLTKLRDEFIKRKTENERDMQALSIAVDKVQNIIDNIDPSLIENARMKGLVIDPVLNIDYDRLKTDNKYLVECKQNIRSLLNDIKTRLTNVL